MPADRPLIFITGDPGSPPGDAKNLCCQRAYLEAVAEAGGLPVILPPFDSPETVAHVRRHADGILFSGGRDLDTETWGGAPHPHNNPLHPRRQSWDLELMSQALEWEEMPLLAICLGIQELNVALGGSLQPHIPDLPDRLEHQRLGLDERLHPVQVVPDTRLAEILGETDIVANTSHHQALDRLGRGLRVAARAPDGIIEAVEPAAPTTRFLLGVQWHPERISRRPPHDRIFRAFVAACTTRPSRSTSTPRSRQTAAPATSGPREP